MRSKAESVGEEVNCATRGWWQPRFALLIGSGFILIGVLSMILGRNLRAAWFRADCGNTCKQIALALQMYAGASTDGLFPALAPEPGSLFFDMDSLVPAYLSEDLGYLPFYHSRYGSERLRGHPVGEQPNPDFHYIGYAIEGEKQLAGFAQAYASQLECGGTFESDLPAPAGSGSWGGNTYVRLHTHARGAGSPSGGIDSGIRVDRSKIPLLIEKLGHYDMPGGYVAYWDGHVEFLTYPGNWPMTESAVELLQSLLESHEAAR